MISYLPFISHSILHKLSSFAVPGQQFHKLRIPLGEMKLYTKQVLTNMPEFDLSKKLLIWRLRHLNSDNYDIHSSKLRGKSFANI